MSNIDERRPKLGYRMQRELLEQLRQWADQNGMTVTSVLTLLVQGLLRGDIKLSALNTLDGLGHSPTPDWMKPPVGGDA